jgi:hypothetical protein
VKAFRADEPQQLVGLFHRIARIDKQFESVHQICHFHDKNLQERFMFFIDIQCPSCLQHRGIVAACLGEFEIVQKAPRTRLHVDKDIIKGGDILCSYAAGKCTHCGKPVLVHLKMPREHFSKAMNCIGKGDLERYTGPQPEILAIFPEPKAAYSHPTLPEEIRKLFVDVQETIDQGRDPSWVASGCRKVLENAVANLGGTGGTLFQKIEDLKARSIITGLLLDWAHQIRMDGNNATHENTYTPAETKELIEFAKIFLQYTFELPARILEKRKLMPPSQPTPTGIDRV